MSQMNNANKHFADTLYTEGGLSRLRVLESANLQNHSILTQDQELMSFEEKHSMTLSLSANLPLPENISEYCLDFSEARKAKSFQLFSSFFKNIYGIRDKIRLIILDHCRSTTVADIFEIEHFRDLAIGSSFSLQSALLNPRDYIFFSHLASNKPVSLDFSNNKWRPGQLFQILQIILSKTLLSLFLDGNCFDRRSIALFCDFLVSESCSLQHCSLRQCLLNTVSEALFQCLGTSKYLSLKSIDISSNNLSDVDLLRLFELLNGSSIECLALGDQKITTTSATSLGRAVFCQESGLTELNLANCKLGQEGLVGFLIAYSSPSASTKLKSLDLSYNGLDDFSPLERLLIGHGAHSAALTEGLKDLTLEGNRPTDASMLRFAGMVSNSRSLKKLDLSNCCLNSTSGVVLLLRLAKSWADSTAPLGFSSAEQGLQNEQHKQDQQQQNQQRQQQGKLRCRPPQQTIQHVWTTSATPPLSELRLARNLLGFRAVTLLAKILQVVPWHPLRSLHLERNHIGDRAMLDLLDATLQDGRILSLHLPALEEPSGLTPQMRSGLFGEECDCPRAVIAASTPAAGEVLAVSSGAAVVVDGGGGGDDDDHHHSAGGPLIAVEGAHAVVSNMGLGHIMIADGTSGSQTDSSLAISSNAGHAGFMGATVVGTTSWSKECKIAFLLSIFKRASVLPSSETESTPEVMFGHAERSVDLVGVDPDLFGGSFVKIAGIARQRKGRLLSRLPVEVICHIFAFLRVRLLRKIHFH